MTFMALETLTITDGKNTWSIELDTSDKDYVDKKFEFINFYKG